MTRVLLYILPTWGCLFVTFLTYAQFTDDFTDGDFTSAPAWSGEDTKFEVDGVFQLHLNAPAVTDEAYLSTQSGAIENATWEFYVELDFNPSSGNRAYVYLVSDQANLKNPLNGYFVMIGNTDDEVSLYRQDGASSTKIIDGLDATVDASPAIVRVQVTRDVTGNWELLIDNTGGSTYTSQGTVFDDTYFQSDYFGVFCDYTSTRSDKFYFDDFNVTGQPYVDADPPYVTFFRAVDASTLKLGWNENMDLTSAENINNYLLNQSIGNPQAATQTFTDTVVLDLSNSLVNGTIYELFISGVEDENANVLNDTTITFTFIQPDLVSEGDVIINEIYADPSPSYGLPDAEYVEIYNTTNKYFLTQNWTIDDGGTPGILSVDTIFPHEYYVLGSAGISDSFPNVNTIEVAGFPSLNNSGDPIYLRDENGDTIDAVQYEISWYQDSDKDDGGYAIELINPNHPCSDQTNWRASDATIGGTPGLENSTYDTTPDTESPEIISAVTMNNNGIAVELNESVESLAVSNAAHSVSPGLGTLSLTVGSGKVNTYSFQTSQLIDSGVVYEYTVSGLEDCWQNAGNTAIEFVLPEVAGPGDIIINEILFNPLTGGEDFVELYNNSDKIISLEGWHFGNYDDSISDMEPIIETPKLFYPQTYWAISEDTLNIQTEYPFSAVGRFIEIGNMPTYANDSGTVYLLRKDSVLVDAFSYNEEMHFELLDDEDGKSLERISFDAPTKEVTNWQTAAENEGFATPGYENSQYQVGTQNGSVTLSPSIFSPDNDGFDDNLLIRYEMDQPGYVMTIEIFDATGRLVKVFKNNELIGTRGQFTWNGLNEKGEKSRSGHYIILVSWFNPAGEKFQKKLTCVLAHRRM